DVNEAFSTIPAMSARRIDFAIFDIQSSPLALFGFDNCFISLRPVIQFIATDAFGRASVLVGSSDVTYFGHNSRELLSRGWVSLGNLADGLMTLPDGLRVACIE
ncbi:MAG: hypothetical protein ACR2PA_16690, partial [Hyphomicrobiaceae bacterium]